MATDDRKAARPTALAKFGASQGFIQPTHLPSRWSFDVALSPLCTESTKLSDMLQMDKREHIMK